MGFLWLSFFDCSYDIHVDIANRWRLIGLFYVLILIIIILLMKFSGFVLIGRSWNV